MEALGGSVAEIVEGRTRLLVPSESMTESVPPRKPAFFNPRAALTRDLSVAAYAAFLRDFEGASVFLEALSGVGARGLRVGNELDVQSVVINDLNPSALEMAKNSARLNGMTNVEFSEEEACRFLSGRSRSGSRGAIVDIDPFGSPAQFFDCGVRATMHKGILSATATDLQVLNGLFNGACKRRYGGIPVRAVYRNEIAIRLILGCLRSVAARLGVTVTPVFVESNMHYYRTYVMVQSRPDIQENMGYILHCGGCKHRSVSPAMEPKCRLCGHDVSTAGPLWTGQIFEKGFVQAMSSEVAGLGVSKVCQKIIDKCVMEADMPGTYFTLDEIASKMGISPPSLEGAIRRLQKNGFLASPTSLNPTGFRTDARIDEIEGIFSSIR